METKGCSKQTHQHKPIYISYQTPLPPYNVKNSHLTIFNKMLFGRSCFQLPRSVEGQKHYLPLLYSLELPGCPMHLFLDFWCFFWHFLFAILRATEGFLWRKTWKNPACPMHVSSAELRFFLHSLFLVKATVL